MSEWTMKNRYDWMHNELEMTPAEIGKVDGISRGAVCKRMEKRGLKRRSKAEARKKRAIADKNNFLEKYRDRYDWMYNDLGMNTNEIAKVDNSSNTTICHRMDVCELDRRSLAGSTQKNISKEEKDRYDWMYNDLGMTTKEIGKVNGTSAGTVCSDMDSCGLERRGRAESHLGKKLSNETKKKISDSHYTPEAIERDRIHGILTCERIRLQKYHVDKRFYSDSIEEGAVALMLEDYVIGKKGIKEGVNFQVKDRGIDNGGIDFLVNDEFLEWHPIQDYDEKDRDVRVMYRELKKDARTPEGQKTVNEWRKDHRDELAVDYWMKRQGAVDDSGYAGANVELARNERELYDFMVKHGADVSYTAFRKDFNDKKKYVKTCKVLREAA
ncbi:hypothetical protein HN499_00570 [archaeon]|nr:hypothetical protein [archaeon]MBT6956660.1 hypothetical protein [archaeon]